MKYTGATLGWWMQRLDKLAAEAVEATERQDYSRVLELLDETDTALEKIAERAQEMRANGDIIRRLCTAQLAQEVVINASLHNENMGA